MAERAGADQTRADRAAWEGEMFRLLAANALDYAIFVVDPHRHVLSWGKGAERLLGFTEAEIVGRKCDLFFTPEDAAAGVPQKELDEALATGRGDNDRWHVRKDGTRFWSSGTVTPLRDEAGTLRGFAAVMRDRTDLKRGQEAAGDALGYAEAIIATVREPLVILDGDLRVRTANRSFYQTFRVRPEDTEGRLLYDLGDRQWDIPALRRLLEDVLPQSTEFNDFEVEHVFPGVGRKVMLLNARKLRREGDHAELILLAIENVTALREAERARREAEARFTEMVRNVRDHSIFLTDPAGVITSWNVAAERVIGYTEAEAVGRHLALIFTPEDVAAGVPEHELRQAREEGRAEEERWHRRKDGSLFWASGVVTPLHDTGGRLSGYSKVLRDMTGWKQADQAIRERERQLQLVTDTTPVFIAHCGADLRYKFVNKPFAGRFGLHPRDIIGRTIPDVLGEGVFARIRPHVEEALAGRRVEFEAELPYDALGPQAVRVAFEPDLDAAGRPVGFVAAVQNVSDRKRAEEALRESEGRLRAIIDNSPSAIFVKDPEGRYLLANRACEAYSREPVERVIGKTASDCFPRELADALRADDRRVLERGEALRYEAVMPARGGTVTALTVKFPLRDAAGRPYAVCGIATDITELKRAGEALRESEAKYRNLFENMAEEVHFWRVVRDDGGRVLTWRLVDANPPALRTWGKTLDQVQGRTTDDIFGPGSTDHYRAVVEKVMVEGVPHSFEDYFPNLGRHFRFTTVPLGEFFITTGADVTALKKTQDVLREREGRVRAVLESITDAFFALGRDWRFTYVNRQAERVLGRTPGDLLGRSIWDEYPGLAGSEFERAYHRVMAERVAASATAFYPDHDRWYEVHVYPAEDGISVYFRDVSDRVRTEAELARLHAESERMRRLYETALSNSPDFNFTFDPDGRFTFANDSLLELWGKSRAEAVGKTPLELGYPPDLADHLLRQVRQAVDSRQPVRDETPFASRFGPREYEYILVPVVGAGGTVEAVVGSAHDITDRKRAEAELRSGAERLVAALDASDTGTFRWNPATGEFLEFDDRLKRLFGFRPDEPVRTTEDFLARVHPADLPGLRTAVAACREGADFEMEYRVVLPGGGVRWLYDRARVVRAGGGPAYLVGACTDITRRKQVEEESRLSRERLDLVVNSVDVGLWYCDLPFDKLDWNAKVKEHFGLPADDDVTIDTFYARLHPDDRDRTRAAIEASIRDRTPYDIEYRTVGLDGRERWLRAIGRTFYGPAGQPVRFDGITLDVTGRVRQEQALSQSEERFRATFEQTAVGILHCDPRDGRVLRANPAACAMTGYSSRELSGKTWQEITHPDDLEPDRTLAGRVLAGEIPSYRVEKRYVRKDGSAVWVDLFGTFVWDQHGRPEYGVAVIVDISDRRAAEQALKASEDRFRQLAEAMPLIVWVADPRGRITYLNRHWSTLTGGTTEDGLGEAWGRFIHPDDLEGVQGVWQSCVRSGRDYQAEYRLRRGDGEYRWQVVRGVPIRDEAGQVARWYGSSTDIDEPKRLAESLREADRRKDEFLATLAHELRNPLAPLRNGLQVMKLAAGKPGAVEQARGMMERQLGQMVRLVDDLLDVSRITRGKLELRRERVDLEGVVQSAVEGSRPLIEANHHDLTVRLPAGPVVLEADPTRLAQVFANLLTNAAKYTDRGGHIRLTADQQGGDVVVSVTDTGIGIPPDKLTSIFEMFTQVDRSLEKAQGGLGIGLTLVRRLVEMHGGSVEARSEGPGKGSEFVVRLPVAAEASVPTRGGGDHESAAPRSSLRILIVDDNRDGADSLGMMLRLMGNDTAAAYDGEEGVDVAGRLRPDVILLDIGLPRLNGYEACRRIRGQPWGRQPVLIAVTGWGQDDDRRRSHEAGFDHHLVKPVDPVALMKFLAGLNGSN